jgi:hypothetical protein
MMIKVIVIDPFKNEIREDSYDGSLEGLYKLGNFELFDVGPTFENGDSVYVDDEGLLKDNQEFFVMAGYQQPLAGIGVVIGTDEEGESVDCKSSLEEIKNKVMFVSKDDALSGVY